MSRILPIAALALVLALIATGWSMYRKEDPVFCSISKSPRCNFMKYCETKASKQKCACEWKNVAEAFAKDEQAVVARLARATQDHDDAEAQMVAAQLGQQRTLDIMGRLMAVDAINNQRCPK